MNLDELWNALTRVRIDAKAQAEKHASMLLEKPLYGWSAEKHAAYHEQHRDEALAVIEYTHARQMQINPD